MMWHDTTNHFSQSRALLANLNTVRDYVSLYRKIICACYKLTCNMPGSPANIEVSSKNQMINHTGSNIWNKSVNSVASIKTLKIEKKLD